MVQARNVLDGLVEPRVPRGEPRPAVPAVQGPVLDVRRERVPEQGPRVAHHHGRVAARARRAVHARVHQPVRRDVPPVRHEPPVRHVPLPDPVVVPVEGRHVHGRPLWLSTPPQSRHGWRVLSKKSQVSPGPDLNLEVTGPRLCHLRGGTPKGTKGKFLGRSGKNEVSEKKGKGATTSLTDVTDTEMIRTSGSDLVLSAPRTETPKVRPTLGTGRKRNGTQTRSVN